MKNKKNDTQQPDVDINELEKMKKDKVVSLRMPIALYKILEGLGIQRSGAQSEGNKAVVLSIRKLLDFYVFPIWLKELIKKKVVSDKIPMEFMLQDHQLAHMEMICQNGEESLKRIKKYLNDHRTKLKKLAEEYNKNIIQEKQKFEININKGPFEK